LEVSPILIEDEWIEDEELLRERVDFCMHEREKAQNAFTVKYRISLDPEANKWELCAEVLSRKDIVELLSEPWA
jgi:hypothetical protein